jgi:hypothetical protein
MNINFPAEIFFQESTKLMQRVCVCVCEDLLNKVWYSHIWFKAIELTKERSFIVGLVKSQTLSY